jgi:hypothetical protein
MKSEPLCTASELTYNFYLLAASGTTESFIKLFFDAEKHEKAGKEKKVERGETE